MYNNYLHNDNNNNNNNQIIVSILYSADNYWTDLPAVKHSILEIQRKGKEGTIAMVWQLHNYQVLKDALNEIRILCQPLHHFRSNGTLMYV